MKNTLTTKPSAPATATPAPRKARRQPKAGDFVEALWAFDGKFHQGVVSRVTTSGVYYVTFTGSGLTSRVDKVSFAGC